MRPVLINPKDVWREAEYYASLSREEKKKYKKLPKDKQIKAFQDFYLNKNGGNNRENEKKAEEMFQHLKDIGVTDLFGTKKEVKTLVTLLKENEQVLYATSGFVNGNTFLIVCTNVRLLFLDNGMVYGLKKFDFPFNKINSVHYKLGVVLGEIEVYHGSTSITISNITKDTVERMATTIQEQIEKRELKPQQNNYSAADELLKYKHLLDQDAITQEEYDMKKKELLNL